MTTPRCVSILANVSVDQKAGRARCTFTRKRKLRTNAKVRNMYSNTVFNISKCFIQGFTCSIWLGSLGDTWTTSAASVVQISSSFRSFLRPTLCLPQNTDMWRTIRMSDIGTTLETVSHQPWENQN